MKSRICEMLGIKYPIFQGAMAWIADASLASAVSMQVVLVLLQQVMLLQILLEKKSESVKNLQTSLLV